MIKETVTMAQSIVLLCVLSPIIIIVWAVAIWAVYSLIRAIKDNRDWFN